MSLMMYLIRQVFRKWVCVFQSLFRFVLIMRRGYTYVINQNRLGFLQKEARYKVMWFYHDDKTCCVLGDVQDFMKGKHQIPVVWLIFTNIRLIHMEVTFLEDVGFHLPLLTIMVGI